MMYDESFQKLGLDNLLESDMTSYEFFHSLPADIQQRVERRDIGSFDEMAKYVSELRNEIKYFERNV